MHQITTHFRLLLIHVNNRILGWATPHDQSPVIVLTNGGYELEADPSLID
jgi:hypothetical protein